MLLHYLHCLELRGLQKVPRLILRAPLGRRFGGTCARFGMSRRGERVGEPGGSPGRGLWISAGTGTATVRSSLRRLRLSTDPRVLWPQSGRAGDCNVRYRGRHERLAIERARHRGIKPRPKPGLPDLIVVNDRKGSFNQLAPLLHSGSLPDGATVGQIWLTIPDLAPKAPTGTSLGYLPTLRLEYLSEDGRPDFSSWIEGMPQGFGSHNYNEDDIVTFCSPYPTLAGSTGRRVSNQPPLPDIERQSVRVRRAWMLAADQEPGEFYDGLTRPYLRDDARHVFPSIGGDTQALHPLLAWWAVLFALSLLASISTTLGRDTST